MTHTIEAIYENGAFRPIGGDQVAIAEGQRVRITVDEGSEPEALRLAKRVYEGLDDQEIDEIERIALDRGNFFGAGSAE